MTKPRANSPTVDTALALARLRDWARTMIEMHGRSQVTDDILAVTDGREAVGAVTPRRP